jgi:hypothetical protein
MTVKKAKSTKFKPYQTCVGRKYREIRKLYRPFAILTGCGFCNCFLTDKNKIKFLGQLLRWFYKSRWGYSASFNMKEQGQVSEGDFIILCARTQKAAFKNLLAKLNYNLIDYTYLKKRQYVLNFTFLFLGVNNLNDNNIYLDISSLNEDIFKIFIIVNGFYAGDFNNIIYYYSTFVYYQLYDYSKLNELCESSFTLFDKSIILESYEEFSLSV